MLNSTVSPQAAKTELARRELQRRHLLEFFKQAWTILEPGTPLHLSWHLVLSCEYLELVTEGKILYLLVNIMPRSAKSRLYSVAFPCWYWLKRPSLHGMFFSYSSNLANDLSDDRRKIIQSSWYQGLCGGMQLSSSKNRISEFENQQRGLMVARGLDSGVTGGGGELLLFDDPNDPDKVESENVRKGVLKKFKDYSITRRNQKDAAVVVVQQRTHTEDVSGYILKDLAGQYMHICLPTEAERDEQIVFPKSNKVVFRRLGELLDPDRFGPEQVAEAKKTLGMYMFAGRHAQRPVPKEGGMVRLSWFQRFYAAPATPTRIIQSWDTAAKAKELNAPWVCGTWLEFDSNYYLIDLFRKQMLYPEGKRMAISLAQKYQPHAILIEDKSTGQALIPELRDDPMFGYSVIAIEPCGDKETRMSVETPAIEAGRVYLPHSAPWLPDFELEVSTFPLSATKDIVDSLSQFLKWVRESQAESWLSIYSMR